LIVRQEIRHARPSWRDCQKLPHLIVEIGSNGMYFFKLFTDKHLRKNTASIPNGLVCLLLFQLTCVRVT